MLISSSIISAAPVYYFNDATSDRATFQAAASKLALESFEDPFASGSTSLSFPIGGAQEFTITSTRGLWQDLGNTRAHGDGAAALGFDGQGITELLFTFVNPIYAFGIDVNDMNFGSMSYLDDFGNSWGSLVGDNGGSSWWCWLRKSSIFWCHKY